MLFFESKYMRFEDGCRCRRRRRDEYFEILDPKKKPMLRCRNTVRFPLSIIVNKPVIEDAAGEILCYIDRPIFCCPVFTLRCRTGAQSLWTAPVRRAVDWIVRITPTTLPCSGLSVNTTFTVYRWNMRRIFSLPGLWAAIYATSSAGRTDVITLSSGDYCSGN